MLVTRIPLLLLVTLLPLVTKTSNILLTVPFKGSHYFAMADIGILLAEKGHKVSFLTMMLDPRFTKTHDNFRIIPQFPTTMNEDGFDAIAEKCIRGIIDSRRDYEMYADSMMSDALCREGWLHIYESLVDYYTGTHFNELIQNHAFDLIIAEERTVASILVPTHEQNIPLVAYVPEVEYSMPREAQNLPMFLSSEPGLGIQVYRGQKPGFWYRAKSLFNLVSGATLMKSGIARVMQPVYEKYNVVDGHEELMERVQLYLINDHIAVSFPYQIPNNVIQIGGSSVGPGKPLQGPLLEFIEKQDQPIILVSVGSYTDMKWLYWSNSLIQALEEMDVAVIVKTLPDSIPSVSDKFYTSNWLPQKDLLFSGKIDLFISHCGNNGKIETILYNVPVLCTPIFAEQALNGEVVHDRGFGEMLLPQEMTAENFRTAISRMLNEKERYVASMKRATEYFYSEPATGTQKMLYYLDILLRDRNLDFLENKMIKTQSSIEIYHLDIIGFVLLLAGFVTMLAGVILVKIVKRVCSILQNKKSKGD